LGVPDSITAKMDPAANGVDEQCSMVFHYKNGMTANLFSTLASNLETDADIFGTQGRIRLTNRFYEPSATIQYYPDIITSRTIIPIEKEPGWGYQYEIRHVNGCLQKGLTESPIWTLDDTMNLMKTLDAVRAIMGLRYSVDG
jgi:predicted dehydrogenase